MDKKYKVPVSLNVQPEKCFNVTLELMFEGKDTTEAKELLSKINGFLDANDVSVLKQKLSVEEDGVEGAIALISEEESDADEALRKLTQNKGNKLWMDYLETQLRMAKNWVR